MVGRVDFFSFCNRPVIKPKDNVAVTVEIRSRHGYWFVGCIREDGQGTGCVKPDPAHCFGVNVMLADSALSCNTDAAPDITCRLFLNRILLACLQRSQDSLVRVRSNYTHSNQSGAAKGQYFQRPIQQSFPSRL